MNLPLDIHTHLNVSQPFEAIQNRYPENFEDKAEGWFSVGIHPWKVGDYQGRYPWAELRRQLALPQVLAVGEAGLDKLCGSPWSEQDKVFRQQALLAEEVGKPLIIHLVRAVDELLAAKKQVRPSVPWIIHGFRGKAAQARQLLSHGFYLSFGWLCQPDALRLTPSHRLFLETDEADVSIDTLVEKAAQIKGISPQEMLELLSENVRSIFCDRQEH